MLNSKTITGESLLKLCYSYTEAINKGAVPCIESAWKYVCQFEAEKHIKELLTEYNKEIESFMKSNPSDSEKSLSTLRTEFNAQL